MIENDSKAREKRLRTTTRNILHKKGTNPIIKHKLKLCKPAYIMYNSSYNIHKYD